VLSAAQERLRDCVLTAAETLLGHPMRSIPDAIEQTGRSLAEHQLV
jgi:hypothetical protein